ncbi:MAG: sugar isomerase domain-containing protein [Opitutus sp.]
MSLASSYHDRANAMLAHAWTVNGPTIAALAPIVGQSLANQGVLHTFGSGHSELIAREIIGRAGGLVCISGVIDPTAGFIENLVGYGSRLIERYDRQHQLLPGESIIVISNSGKNSSPIEVAQYAKQKGLNVIGLTSMAMSRTTKTVHPSGQRIHEVADFVLDNGGIPGDTVIEVRDGIMSGPTSTFIGCSLLNWLMLSVVEWLRDNGHPLPILRSQNLPDAIEHNRRMGELYQGRLSRQLA